LIQVSTLSDEVKSAVRCDDVDAEAGPWETSIVKDNSVMTAARISPPRAQ
jgi:hypothetical protein